MSDSHESIRKSISDIRRECHRLGLENACILDKYSDDQLATMFNGIGPDTFPSWMVDLIDSSSPSLVPACMIHDVEWAESDGSRETFTATNERLFRNGCATAKALYAWYRPLRYLTMMNAACLDYACQIFGWRHWKSCHSGRLSMALAMYRP